MEQENLLTTQYKESLVIGGLMHEGLICELLQYLWSDPRINSLLLLESIKCFGQV